MTTRWVSRSALNIECTLSYMRTIRLGKVIIQKSRCLEKNRFYDIDMPPDII